MNQLNSIGPVQGPQQSGAAQSAQSKQSTNGPSFKDTLNKYLSDVNEMQNKADESIKRMAAGEITDVHQVMSSVEEANVAFNMMMEIRNKVLDAYQEIMRIRM